MTFNDRDDFDLKFGNEWPEERLAEYFASEKKKGNIPQLKGADDLALMDFNK